MAFVNHILHNIQFWILLIQYKLIWINAFSHVSLDLKKAFDTVNRGILLNKLEHYGFHAIINEWLFK